MRLRIGVLAFLATAASAVAGVAQSPEDLLRMILQGSGGNSAIPIPGVPSSRTVRDAEVLALQRMLNAAGFNVGPADGVMGPATLRAISAYQLSIGATPTGRLTGAQRTALAGRTASATPLTTPAIDIRTVQAHLAERGYDVGVVDGHWGPRSQRALDAFRREVGIGLTGPASAEDLAMLRGGGNAATEMEVVTFRTAGADGRELMSLPVVDGGGAFRVFATGPGAAADRLALVPAGATPHAGTASDPLVENAPVPLTAPAEAGAYDIIWISHRDGGVLLRRRVEIR